VHFERRDWEESSHYDTAQVCVNGYVITNNIEHNPELTAPRCDECGAETITACPSRAKLLRGRYHVPGVAGAWRHTAPKYCHKCGAAYPWTQAKLDALRELVNEIESLTADEKDRLSRSLDDLIAETPRTEVAVTRLKKGLARAGAEVAVAAKNILVDIASEAAKKRLGI
jgi:hypothetical protein